MTHTINRTQIVDMLRREAMNVGLTLDRLVQLGRSDQLDNPVLRDLWLIWGDEVLDTDLTDATPA